jgi:predicted DCC family thiol-disulfide oxidoreductase YuxK
MAKAIVIYDADCGFCRWSLALLLTADRPRVGRSGGERRRPSPPTQQSRWGRSAASYALRPLPLGTPEADQLLADLSVEERNASWHLFVGAEATPRTPAAGACPPAGASGAAAPAGPARFSAGAALSPALALLPHGRIPSALVARIPRSTERGYRWVADHRGLLGRFVPARARRWADRVIAAHGGPCSQ